MTFKALIFDMDGTLLDNMHVHNSIWSEYLAEHGVHLTPTEIGIRTASLPNPQIIRMFLGEGLEPDLVWAKATEKEDRYRDRLARGLIEPLPGLRAFLDEIAAAGLPRAVASSASRVNLDFTLKALRLETFFQAVISSEDVLHGKPHPEPFLKAAERLGQAPGDCLVFEDSSFGLLAAQNAGMRAVALTTSHPAEELRHFPHLIGLMPDYQAVSLAGVLEGRLG
ncbi:MAG: HAD family phosphatase [Anaerolineales bacterium]|nr:HAD family phosphatase [Anaerolineales bacterium]